MPPESFSKFIWACFHGKINPDRIMQTVGTARASAGTHKADSTIKNRHGAREPVTGAVDIRTRDLTEGEIESLLTWLYEAGFVGWWRHEGSFAENQHIHAIYVGMYLKPLLCRQFWDFIGKKDGLAGHGFINHVRATVEQNQKLIKLFSTYNGPSATK
jgi:hypothetical protein